MQNIVVNMCEKFRNDRLRNDRTLKIGKSDNKKKQEEEKQQQQQQQQQRSQRLETRSRV